MTAAAAGDRRGWAGDRRDVSWARSWNEVQLVFADGTVSSLAPGGEFQTRMVYLARNLLTPSADDPSTYVQPPQPPAAEGNETPAFEVREAPAAELREPSGRPFSMRIDRAVVVRELASLLSEDETPSPAQRAAKTRRHSDPETARGR